MMDVDEMMLMYPILRPHLFDLSLLHVSYENDIHGIKKKKERRIKKRFFV